MTKPKRNVWILAGALASALLLFAVAKVSNPWRAYTGSMVGIQIEGDESASPTTSWNHWLLNVWDWKAVAVFQVPVELAKRGYHVGFKPAGGPPMVDRNPYHDQVFRVKRGREDCIFFAVDSSGTEVPITLVALTNKDDTRYQDARLH